MSARKIAFANSCKLFASHQINDLKRLGFDVIFCRNSEQVLQLFDLPHNEQPNMLITDSLLAHGDEFTYTETRQSLETGVAIYKKLRLTISPLFPVIIYSTDELIVKKLCEIRDPFMIAVDNSTSSSRQEIFQAVKRLCP